MLLTSVVGIIATVLVSIEASSKYSSSDESDSEGRLSVSDNVERVDWLLEAMSDNFKISVVCKDEQLIKLLKKFDKDLPSDAKTVIAATLSKYKESMVEALKKRMDILEAEINKIYFKGVPVQTLDEAYEVFERGTTNTTIKEKKEEQKQEAAKKRDQRDREHELKDQERKIERRRKAEKKDTKKENERRNRRRRSGGSIKVIKSK